MNFYKSPPKPAECIAEQKCKQDRHDQQKHKSLEITRELQEVFECNIENADHGWLLRVPSVETPHTNGKECRAPQKRDQHR